MTPDQIALPCSAASSSSSSCRRCYSCAARRRTPTLARRSPAGSLSSRGWSGPGGGMSNFIQPPAEWRGNYCKSVRSVAVRDRCRHADGGRPAGPPHSHRGDACRDPISWFQRAKLISNPSLFVLGKPGLEVDRRRPDGDRPRRLRRAAARPGRPSTRLRGGRLRARRPGHHPRRMRHPNVLDPGEYIRREAAH